MKTIRAPCRNGEISYLHPLTKLGWNRGGANTYTSGPRVSSLTASINTDTGTLQEFDLSQESNKSASASSIPTSLTAGLCLGM